MKTHLITALEWLRDVISIVFDMAISAIVWIALLTIGGAGLVVAGVFVIAGVGAALLTAGAFLLAAAWMVRSGVVNG